MKTLNYNVIFRPELEGGFTAFVPALPGCVSYGRTLNEAKKMAQDAIAGYITSLQKHKQPIPNDSNSFIALLSVVEGKNKVYA